MRTLILLSLSLSLFACGGDSAIAEADGAMENATEKVGGAMANATEKMDMVAAEAKSDATDHLESTVEAVQSAGGDLTALPVTAAAHNINGWINKLADVDGADGITDGLAKLKEELLRESVDGGSVSAILSELSTETRAMSDKVPALGTLANLLDAGAKKLADK